MRKLASLTSLKTLNHQTKFPKTLIPSTQNLHSSSTPNDQNPKTPHLLQNPSEIQSLNQTKSFHAHLITTNSSFQTQKPVFLYNNLISNYASFHKLHIARKVFDEMPERNSVSYNSMICSYSRDGFFKEALEVFLQMRVDGFMPNGATFGGLLTCRSLEVFEGMQLHGLIEKCGVMCVDAYGGTALLGLYGRHGYLDEAVGVFRGMKVKSLVTWNSMMSLFGQTGYTEDCVFMLLDLMRSCVGVSESSFVSVLSCLEEDDVRLGEQMHGLVIKYGFDNVCSVSNCLINMYAVFDEMQLVEKIFETAPVKDIVSWNTLIGAMGNSDRPMEALCVFVRMCVIGLSPDERTLVNVLNSCSRLRALYYGESIHVIMIKKRFESDVYAGSSLINFYAKCDKLLEAHVCFDGITLKNLVCWNALMMGYSKKGSSYSVHLFQEMIRSGFYPSAVSFSTVVKSSPPLELRQLHSLSVKMGYQENAYVSSSLISSYARNDLVSDALIFVGSDTTNLPVVTSNVIAWIYNQTGQYDKTQDLYASMENPDTISWNILIAACSRNGDNKETFELFDHMRESQVRPDNYTYVSLFNVCTKLCNLALGASLHALILKTDFNLCDTFLRNTMIDMYGKCGSIGGATKIFNEMTEKNLISWTALISALGLHGHGNEALEIFREMERVGLKMDKVAFIAVLSACRHVGLVKEGMELFSEMRTKYGVEPDIDHYIIMVDLLTRYGHVKEAEKFILGMPIAPNALIWRSFLEGCKKQQTFGGHGLFA